MQTESAQAQVSSVMAGPVDAPSVNDKPAENKDDAEGTETTQPRRSTRITSVSKPATEDTKKVSAPKKRSAAEADEIRKVEENGSGAKKARGTKAKKTDEVTEGIAIGEPLPDIVVKTEKGEAVSVKALADGHAGIVLFLVPKADTPGCNNQACGFRDIYPDFQALNFAVFCLSADLSSTQLKWQIKKSLPYSILSDPERALVSVLTGSPSKTARSHFIFADGKLLDKKMPVKPVDSPRLALEFIQSLGKPEEAVAVENKPAAETEIKTAPATDATTIPDVKMDDTTEGEKIVASEDEKALPGLATAA